ncbi:hypothetical protein C4568_03760 [Candidatus Parcubacteria bacterium]|nr:MAG: hypothetical protein C4568_03760 [Candidatus Parcubacteria bacterium]
MDILKTIIVAGAISLSVAIGFSVIDKGEVVGALSSPNVPSYLNVQGYFVQGGGVSTVTPVTSTVTLTHAQMVDANVITFTASSTQAALTATLPASTTFPLPVEAGSYRSWVIENPFTAAATTTTIAAGTGIDLQVPDGQNVVIGINNYAFLTCLREASTDIVCRVDETIPAD